MSNYGYRFSIIPPGAIIDPRVTPRALQVLCLLGRHINDGGWCSRSQVKMARELGCSRSAVQEACNVLIDTGWVETRRNGRGGTGPESSEHPFAALSYRVRLDRDDLTAVVTSADEQAGAVENNEGGAAIAAGGAAQAAGGATIPAPLEGTPSEGIYPEPERDTRARDHEEFARWLSAFTTRWPTAAADDQNRIATAGRSLTREQRKAALEKIPEFLDHLDKHKRKHIPAGWNYLEQLRWEKLPSVLQPASAATLLVCDEGTPQWAIWQAVYAIARPRGGAPSFKLTGVEGRRKLTISHEIPDAAIWMADTTRPLETYVEGSKHFAAWWRWLCDLMPAAHIQAQHEGDKRVLRVRHPWPPRKDGTMSTSDPPRESSAA